MGESYLIDTNAIADYMAEKFPMAGLSLMDEIVNSRPPLISVITQIELLGQSKIKANTFLPFILAAEILNLTDAVIHRTIAIRKSRKIKIPDANIAATAIENDLTLITHNVSDFDKIQNLKILDLYTIM